MNLLPSKSMSNLNSTTQISSFLEELCNEGSIKQYQHACSSFKVKAILMIRVVMKENFILFP